MKAFFVPLVVGYALVAAATASGQVTGVHRFTGINLRTDQTISLTVTGSVPVTYLNYYDQFPVEVSPDLANWTPLATLFRTNRLADATVLTDSDPRLTT